MREKKKGEDNKKTCKPLPKAEECNTKTIIRFPFPCWAMQNMLQLLVAKCATSSCRKFIKQLPVALAKRLLY